MQKAETAHHAAHHVGTLPEYFFVGIIILSVMLICYFSIEFFKDED